MTKGGPLWVVSLTASAESDFRNITAWTLTEFGYRQARKYSDILSAALIDLASGPSITGARSRNELGRGLFTLHVARNGRNGRHFVLLRVKSQNQIEVLRLLHDSMDLKSHLLWVLEAATAYTTKPHKMGLRTGKGLESGRGGRYPSQDHRHHALR
jgi:toxin ParE1/3/4